MIIKNGLVFQADGSFRKMDLFVKDHKLVASQEEVTDQRVVDAEGLKVIAGLVDIHSHGAFGHDFSDADAQGLKVVLKYEKAHGITSYCPTSMTLPLEELEKIFQTAHEAGEDEEQARIVGINMEGPFLDAPKKGAHVEAYIRRPQGEFFEDCQKAAKGLIKLVTLAPNVEGAREFIREYQDKVAISLGHTAADYDCAREAMEAGAHHVTPLQRHAASVAPGARDDRRRHRRQGVCGGAHQRWDSYPSLCGSGHLPAVPRQSGAYQRLYDGHGNGKWNVSAGRPGGHREGWQGYADQRHHRRLRHKPV